MINVDNPNLKNTIEQLKKIINEYENIELNLFNQLKDSCINWQDGNSLIFTDKIYLEKKETDILLENLKEKKDLYKFIYDKYIDIGKKISCNLNKKAALLNSIEKSISLAQSAINAFNNVDMSFPYAEQGAILEQKQKIISIKNQLPNIKESINEMFKKIEQIEREINSKIKSLEQIKMDEFNFSVYEKNS